MSDDAIDMSSDSGIDQSKIMLVFTPKGLVAFTVQESEGAIPNGSQVAKVNSDDDDAHSDGAVGTILGSLATDSVPGEDFAYFIEWDDCPGVPVAIRGSRIVPRT